MPFLRVTNPTFCGGLSPGLQRAPALRFMRYCSSTLMALKIDRQAALERAWQRQRELEAQDEVETRTCALNCIAEVRDLHHLESWLERAGSRVVVLDLYNNACGSCKEIEKHLRSACKISGEDDMGPIFLKHNIRDARDDLTDVALTFRARHAPAVLLFKDEAMHWSMTGRNMPILMRAIERLDIKDGETPAGTWN